LNHLENRGADTAAQVEGHGHATADQILQSLDVRLRQVGHMNVVPDGRAIGGGVVRAEDVHVGPQPERRLDGERDQVRFGVVILADLTVRIGAGGVEIAQCGPLQPVSFLVPAQHPLHEELRFAIRIDGRLRMILGDGDTHRLAVSGAGGRKNDPRNPLVQHGAQQVQRVRDVVLKVLARGPHGLPYVSVRRKMNHGFDAPGGERSGDGAAIGQIAADEGAPSDSPLMALAEVVEDHGLEARPGKGLGRMAADVPRAAGHQHPHG